VIRFRVAGLTSAGWLKLRDTVEGDTPAAFATATISTFPLSISDTWTAFPTVYENICIPIFIT
jgi:hypothetical protein